MPYKSLDGVLVQGNPLRAKATISFRAFQSSATSVNHKMPNTTTLQ